MIEADEAMKLYNDNLIKLHKNLLKAISTYFKEGHVNVLAVIGLLDDHKLAVKELAKKLEEPHNFQHLENPPSYIS